MKYTLTFSLLSMLAICSSQAADPLPVSKDYWKSDAFRKAFNGSYRINAWMPGQKSDGFSARIS